MERWLASGALSEAANLCLPGVKIRHASWTNAAVSKSPRSKRQNMATRVPNILWAQRTATVYLTIDLQEAENPQVKLENADEGHGRVIFKGKAKSHATGNEAHKYELDLELHGPVDSEQSKISVTPRHIVLVVAKKADQQGFWPRLTKDKAKHLNIKADWDKWVDEDEEEDAGVDPESQFDLSSLSNFSNFQAGGAGAGAGALADDDLEDSDDEEMPELEKA